MAYLNEIRFPREVKDARQVMDCLRQMDDQVRYTLQNLDGNNIRAGAIGESHLSGALQRQIRTAERTGEDLSSLRQSLETVSAALEELNGSAVMRFSGSAGFSLYVGDDQPGGHNVVWIKPAASQGDGAQACEIAYIP